MSTEKTSESAEQNTGNKRKSEEVKNENDPKCCSADHKDCSADHKGCCAEPASKRAKLDDEWILLQKERAALLAERDKLRRADDMRMAELTKMLESAQCPVCRTAKVQVVSFGSCQHSVCLDCVFATIDNALLMPRQHKTDVQRATVQLRAEGDLAALACPTCRAGAIDLMGSRLTFKEGCVYHCLALSLAESKRPRPTSVEKSEDGKEKEAEAAFLAGVPAGVSDQTRTLALEAWRQSRRAAHIAVSTVAATAGDTTTAGDTMATTTQDIWSCRWCGDLCLGRGESEDIASRLRHQLRCPKRRFRCPFPSCGQYFSWENAFSGAPKVVTTDNESQWLTTLNAAFAVHVVADCGMKWACQDRRCPKHKSSMDVKGALDHQARHRMAFLPLQPLHELHLKLHVALECADRLSYAVLCGSSQGVAALNETAAVLAPNVKELDRMMMESVEFLGSACAQLGISLPDGLAILQHHRSLSSTGAAEAVRGDDEDDVAR